MTGDCHVQFGERLEGKFLRPTQLDVDTPKTPLENTAKREESTANNLSLSGSPSLRNQTTAVEELEFEKAFHGIAMRDEEKILSRYSKADQAWREFQEARSQRAEQWNSFMQEKELLRRAQEHVTEEEQKCAQQDSETTFLKPVIDLLTSEDLGAVAALNAHVQIVLPVVKAITKGVSYLFQNQGVLLAKTEETINVRKAAKEEKDKQTLEKKAQKAGRKAQAMEEKIRADEIQETQKAVSILNPPIEHPEIIEHWQNWATQIRNALDLPLDVDWVDRLASKGVADPIWVIEKVTAAWRERMEISNNRKKEFISKLEELKKLAMAFSTSSNEAEIRMKEASDIESKKQEAQEKKAAAKLLLKKLNEEQQQLEDDVNKRKLTDLISIATKRREKEEAILAAQSELKKQERLFKAEGKKLKREDLLALQAKQKAHKDLERYLDHEEFVSRERERIESCFRIDQNIWNFTFQEYSENIEAITSKIEPLLDSIKTLEDAAHLAWKKAISTSAEDSNYRNYWEDATEIIKQTHFEWNDIHQCFQKNQERSLLPLKKIWNLYVEKSEGSKNFWLEKLKKVQLLPPLSLGEEKLEQNESTALDDLAVVSLGQIILPKITEQDYPRLALREKIDCLKAKKAKKTVSKRPGSASNLHKAVEEADDEEVNLTIEWRNLAREKDAERLTAGGLRFSDDEKLIEAWKVHDRNAIIDRNENDEQKEKKARDARVAADHDRLEARAYADRLSMELNRSNERYDKHQSLANFENQEWLEKREKLKAISARLDRKHQEARAAWNEKASSHETVRAVLDQGEVAIENAKVKLKADDRFILALRKEFQQKLHEGTLDGSIISIIPATGAEIEHSKEVMLQQKQKALTSSLENYKTAVEEYALETARINAPGMKEAWVFRGFQAEEEAMVFKNSHEENEETARLDRIAAADKAGLTIFTLELQRIDDAKKSWIDANRVAQERREAAAVTYAHGDHLPWSLLTPEEREAYNISIINTKAIRTRAALDKAIEDAEEKVKQASIGIGAFNPSSFYFSHNKAANNVKEAEAALAKLRLERYQLEEDRERSFRKIKQRNKKDSLSLLAKKAVCQVKGNLSHLKPSPQGTRILNIIDPNFTGDSYIESPRSSESSEDEATPESSAARASLIVGRLLGAMFFIFFLIIAGKLAGLSI